MMRRLTSLWRDRRGSAAIEFAAASLFLFATLIVGLDFGVYEQQKLRLGSAIEQAADIAFTTQSTAKISAYIQAAAQMPTTLDVQVTCNGTSTCGDGKCSCLTSGGAMTAASSCNSSCATGAISGNYVKIVASTTYAAMVVPDKWLGGKSLSQTAVLRLP